MVAELLEYPTFACNGFSRGKKSRLVKTPASKGVLNRIAIHLDMNVNFDQLESRMPRKGHVRFGEGG